MKVNKKMLQQQLSVEFRRIVILRDLTNLTVKMKQSMSRNDLVHVAELLEQDYGIIIFREIDREIRKNHVSIFLALHPYIILEKP